MVAEGLWSEQNPAGLVHAYVGKPITADAQHGSAMASSALENSFTDNVGTVPGTPTLA
jgi:hypothetical protein